MLCLLDSKLMNPDSNCREKSFSIFPELFEKSFILSKMPFRHAVALEAVLIAALLLAHLAVPSKLFETRGLYAIPDGLRGEKPILGILFKNKSQKKIKCWQ